MSNIFDIELAQRHTFATSMVTAAINSQRLSHAYLLSGRVSEPVSDGAPDDKWSLARQVAAYLNCAYQAERGGQACHMSDAPEQDHCVNCKWINQGKHPQAWLTLTSEGSKSGKIAVERSRLLSDELSKSSEFFRVVVIAEASQEAFHRPAANALLKTIEDPGSRCLFFLFANREDDVLPTVVSRCQVIPMQSPPGKPTALAGAILKTGDAPLFVAPELKNFSDSLQQIFNARDSHLTLHALDLARQMQIAIEEVDNLVSVLDLATNLEISRIGERACIDRVAAGYLSDLLSLAEDVKLQIGHYVSSKAAIETFVLSWWQLRKTAGC